MSTKHEYCSRCNSKEGVVQNGAGHDFPAHGTIEECLHIALKDRVECANALMNVLNGCGASPEDAALWIKVSRELLISI